MADNERNESNLRERYKRRRVKKGKAIIVFLLLFAVFLGLCYGGWRIIEAYSTPWGPPLPVADTQRLPSVEFQDRYMNILIIGLHNGETKDSTTFYESDSIMVMSLDKVNGKIRYILLPRETQVEIPGRKGIDKLANAYQYGGKRQLVQTVERLLQIPIQHYLLLKAEALPAIIDAMGGVEIYVEQDMYYKDPLADPPLEINLKKGTHKLNGEQALHFIRYRSDELGDTGRSQRQQRFLKNLNEQLGSWREIPRYPWIVSSMIGRVETDLSAREFVKIIWYTKGSENNYTGILPGKFSGLFWIPDLTQLGNQMKELFPIQTVNP